MEEKDREDGQKQAKDVKQTMGKPKKTGDERGKDEEEIVKEEKEEKGARQQEKEE